MVNVMEIELHTKQSSHICKKLNLKILKLRPLNFCGGGGLEWVTILYFLETENLTEV